MAQSAKWIEASPGERLVDVAARSLRKRLKPVRRYLSLAAKHAEEDIEYLHQLRVWSRRAHATVRMYGELLPRRRAAWIKKQLKRIRSATNDARDDDVFTSRLVAEPADPCSARLLPRVRAHRREAQQPLRDLYRRLTRGDRFDRRVSKLLQRVRPRRKPKRKKMKFGKWAERRLPPLVCDFLDAGRRDLSDDENLHQFRIRGKTLRYALELLSAAFPSKLHRDVYPLLSELQERLGEVNDHAAAQTRIGHWIDQDDNPEELACLNKMLQEERLQQQEKRDAFFAWWTSEREQELQAAFERVFPVECGSHERMAQAPCDREDDD